jgi:hypothetical protein
VTEPKDTVPEPRKITRENATEVQIDELTGERLPVDDGKDDPRFEYETFQTNRGPVRVPLRRK